ncbi:hypothetical protein R6Q59_011054 [Mikania micrantha]
MNNNSANLKICKMTQTLILWKKSSHCFFSDSMRLIHNVETALKNYPMDFCKLDDYMHQFMGSSSSIGAKKVKEECIQFQECCKATNADGCIRAFHRVKQEHSTLKRKLETYFQILRQGA